HGRVVPYLGGVALCLAFVLSILFFYGINRKMAVVLVGLLMVVALGVLDDVYKLKPWQKLLGQLLVGLFLVVGGIGVDFVNMPFGGVYSFNNWNVDMVLGGWMWHINIFSAIITISLSVVLMNSINFLDGMDGLASMVSLVVFVVMFFLCNAMYVSQPDSARMSIAMAGAIMGFLPYNLPKASIFLGDSGSMMLGYVMAVLSILSGSKVATLLLVLGIVILDTMYVIWSRYRHGRKVWQADRSHLHYKLLDRGYSEWTVLGIYFMISLLLGLAALLLSNGWSKALLMLMFFGGCIFFIVRFVDKKIEN
ncbi:MAG TPA: MraY family glycosyltransferase, partial [bacterium]|nr:MraY family glycosyltransferase [bacterium]